MDTLWIRLSIHNFSKIGEHWKKWLFQDEIWSKIGILTDFHVLFLIRFRHEKGIFQHYLISLKISILKSNTQSIQHFKWRKSYIFSLVNGWHYALCKHQNWRLLFMVTLLEIACNYFVFIVKAIFVDHTSVIGISRQIQDLFFKLTHKSFQLPSIGTTYFQCMAVLPKIGKLSSIGNQLELTCSMTIERSVLNIMFLSDDKSLLGLGRSVGLSVCRSVFKKLLAWRKILSSIFHVSKIKQVFKHKRVVFKTKQFSNKQSKFKDQENKSSKSFYSVWNGIASKIADINIMARL